ncbi:MAG TPA: hypothetical protein VGM92_06810 [Candidatus Kapabacteria bacterium]|jgi:hypothetical protein
MALRKRLRQLWLVLLSLMMIFHSQAAECFTANGHNVIEATAYRHLLGRMNIPQLSIIAGHPFSGKDALDILIAYRILDAPRGWWRENVKDPLSRLPVIRSGNLDYILSRQFEGNSQCFHFMARASDVYWDTTTDPIHHYPHMLYDSAYPRCIAFLTSTFHIILHNALAARSGDHDVYGLMHSIADSYSAAHCERDSNATKTGVRWTILYLKVWEPTAYIPYLFHPDAKPFFDGPWGHKMTDDRDYDYWKDADGAPMERQRLSEDEAVMDTDCSSSTNPYQVEDGCLSPRAEQAVNAVESLLMVLAENVLREKLYHGIDTAFEHASWKDYLATYFAGWKDIDDDANLDLRVATNVAPARFLRPDETEWRPLFQVGIDYHPTYDGLYAEDVTADLNLDIPVAMFGPVVPGIVLDFGEREYGGTLVPRMQRSSEILRLGYAMAFEFADDFIIRTVPFEREFVMTAHHAGETRNLVSFLQVQGMIDRHFWFRLEAPRFSNQGWIKNDYGVAVGISEGWDFGKWFSEHTGDDEPLALQGEKWNVPDTEQIKTAELGSGKSISGTIIDMRFRHDANRLFTASLQLLWDRNSSGERNKGLANGVELYYAPSSQVPSTVLSTTAEAGYVLRYYLNPHLAITSDPIEAVSAINGTVPHPSGNLRWDAETSIGITALLSHIDLTLGIARISWRDALAGDNPFFQAFPAELRIAANFFWP